jgi:hypothetical protein
MMATALEQLCPAADPRYVIGRCPTCLTWRLVPATAPTRCWACAGEPQPELERRDAPLAPHTREDLAKGKHYGDRETAWRQ